MTFAAISYLAGLVACLAGALFASRREDSSRLGILRMVLIGSAAWSMWMVLLEVPTLVLRLAPFTPLVETLRYGLLLVLISRLGQERLPRALVRFNAVGLLTALLASIFLPFIMAGSMNLLSRVGLALSSLGLVNVEQLLRNASPVDRRALKFLALAVGSLCAVDLFVYSQAELLGGLNPGAWAARGLTLAASVPFMVIALRRLADDRSNVFVSRQVVFYTTAFVSVGVYLIVMALGGYYVREHGGKWGESLRILFLVGAGVVLLTLLLADAPWRQLKVFLAKHFFRNKYDYRLEWLRFSRALSTRKLDDAPGLAVHAVAQIFESPAGVLFQSQGGHSFVATAVWPATSSYLPPAVDSGEELVQFLRDSEWVIDIDEYRRSPEVYRNARLPSWLTDPASGWRIVAPLLGKDMLVGFIALKAPPPPFHITFEDRDLLHTVGRHVAMLLAQHAADQKLAQNRQFETFHRLTAFVMHDLKNSVAQLQLVVSNAARHRSNPEFLDDAISTIANTVDRMNRLIGQLSAHDSAGQPRGVSLDAVVRASVARSEVRLPVPRLLSPPAETRVMADADRLGAILDHVMRNAQDAAGQAGQVTVALGTDGAQATLEVCDDGPGMTEEFVRNRLFRPFDSTKGARGMGIGAYQTREYVREIGGDVEVQSSPGEGTRFIIRLPECPIPDPGS